MKINQAGPAALAVCAAVALFAKDKPRITINVVRVDVMKSQEAVDVPPTKRKTSSTCAATLSDPYPGALGTSTANSNCETTTTPGSPASTQLVTVRRSFVRIIFPDGSKDGKHVTLVCKPGFFTPTIRGAAGGRGGPIAERCRIPDPGAYEAEVSGNNVTVVSHNLEGKEQKDTFTAAGGWQ